MDQWVAQISNTVTLSTFNVTLLKQQNTGTQTQHKAWQAVLVRLICISNRVSKLKWVMYVCVLETYPTSSIMQPDHLSSHLHSPVWERRITVTNYERLYVRVLLVLLPKYIRKKNIKVTIGNENTHRLKCVSYQKRCRYFVPVTERELWPFPFHTNKSKKKKHPNKSLWHWETEINFHYLKSSSITTTANLIDSASLSVRADSAHVWSSSPVAMETVASGGRQKIH